MSLDLGSLIAGDTLDKLVEVSGYAASDGWTLHYRLLPISGTGDAITFASTDDSGAHRVTVAAATTATWAAGRYSWAAWVAGDEGSHTVATGTVTIAENPRTASVPLDLRSDARKALEAAEAALASWTPTTKSYTIGGRSMTFNSSAEILPIISYWKLAVQREDRAARLAAGRPDPRKTFVRLGRG
jgi:hypothetical protein